MLLILTSAITSRLGYITSLLIRDILGVELKLTLSTDEFDNHPGPKLSYSNSPMANGLFIEACSLLFEETITPVEIIRADFDEIPVIFTSDNPSSCLPFDPFAAAFYMVTRYEEYLPHKKDKYGRFTASESIAYKEGFLDIPVVNHWAELLRKVLLNNFSGLITRHPEYRYVPTIDVDHAYCYRGRTLARTIGGVCRDAFRGHFADLVLRCQVLSGVANDPYDNYSFINSIHESYNNFPLYFILYADKGGDDNNVTVTSKSFHELLRALDQHKGVGIHPSLASNHDDAKLNLEHTSLCLVIERNVTISRQHFLYLSMPQTYRSLIRMGISDDYSMGFASHPGFRAGIALPFHFFDLISDSTTSLLIHPVSLMDVTMKDYLRLSTDECLETIYQMVRTIKSVNGEFVSLWHNESLGETTRWKGWRRIYNEMVKTAST